MSGGFDDQRADEAFIQIAKLVAGLRDNRPELQSIELAYGLLQVCSCMEDSEAWREFLRAALDECIAMEGGE